MPTVDLIDEMRDARDDILKMIQKHAGKSGASLLSERVESSFESLIEFAEDERVEWEKVINFLMEKEFDD
jgi:hypothetical protein